LEVRWFGLVEEGLNGLPEFLGVLGVKPACNGWGPDSQAALIWLPLHGGNLAELQGKANLVKLLRNIKVMSFCCYSHPSPLGFSYL
jgi:hypothetical protein